MWYVAKAGFKFNAQLKITLELPILLCAGIIGVHCHTQLCGAGDKTQDFVHTAEAFYILVLLLDHFIWIIVISLIVQSLLAKPPCEATHKYKFHVNKTTS